MDPDQIPFNALFVGPTNSGKTKYLVDQLSSGPFRGKFDYIVLVCPTYVHNKTYNGFADNDDRVFVVTPAQDEVDTLLRALSLLFEGTNTLLIIDDCAASKDLKGRSNQLVNLAFSARHIGISVWVVTQQFTSIAKPYRENIAVIVLFYTPSAKDMKAIFESYAGELSSVEKQELLNSLKSQKHSRLVFSLRHPYHIQLELPSQVQ